MVGKTNIGWVEATKVVSMWQDPSKTDLWLVSDGHCPSFITEFRGTPYKNKGPQMTVGKAILIIIF